MIIADVWHILLLGMHGKETTINYSNVFGTRKNIARPVKSINITGSTASSTLVHFNSKTEKENTLTKDQN